ncbi:MAG: heme-binding protein [Pseudomonadota bacterium]
MLKIFGLTAALLFTWSSHSLATPTTLTSNQATTLAQKAVSIALQQGYKVTATVVDADGNLIAAVRGDGAYSTTPRTSYKKAFTAIVSKQNTSDLLLNIHKGDPNYMNKFILSTLDNNPDNIIFLGGAILIKHKDTVIGAIGVGGAPGGHLDDNIALQALKELEL